MEPTLLDGQVIIVDRDASPRVGEIVVARPDGEWVVKRLRARRQHMLELRADNPAYTEVWTVDERQVVGVAAAACQDLRLYGNGQ